MLTISESGEVVDLQPSITRFHLANRFSGEFLAAIRSAVSTWRFEPARNVHWRTTPGKEDAYLRTETVSATVEMRFTFETSDPARATR